MMGASMVLVPLVFSASIALVVPVPVFVNVSLMLVLELVMSYPDVEVPEKYNSWMVSEALKFGCTDIAELKTARSPEPGTPLGFQLVLVLKSVPEFFQVLSEA